MSYYDRQGNPVEMMTWAKDFEDGDNRIVKQDYAGPWWISTVFLGLDHSFGDGPPLIFETMVFAAEDGKVTSYADEYCERYTSEASALEGHERALEWARERPDGVS